MILILIANAVITGVLVWMTGVVLRDIYTKRWDALLLEVYLSRLPFWARAA